jgi:hypothetical protein
MAKVKNTGAGDGVTHGDPRGENLRYFNRDWMTEYTGWYRDRFKKEPPAIKIEYTAKNEPVFTVDMGYTTHIRPAQNLIGGLKALKNTLPKEAFFSVVVKDVEGGESVELSYLSETLKVTMNPHIFTEGNTLQVKVKGGPDDRWREKAGWFVSNILGDESFDYRYNMPIPAEKWGRLLKTVKD